MEVSAPRVLCPPAVFLAPPPSPALRPRPRFAFLALAFAVAALAGGCADIRPRPLDRAPDLKASLKSLDRTLPAEAPRDPPHEIAIGKPLSIGAIGLLAILNDPELKTERGHIGLAEARLIAARILPNPAAELSIGALLGGPGTATAYAASLGESLTQLITYRPRVASAKARLGAVNADLLWREWQVAQKARQLALDIYWEGRAMALLYREARFLDHEAKAVRAAIKVGNLELSALAPVLAARAANARSLAAMRLTRLKDRQALDALLGLLPRLRFAIARPSLAPLPADFEALVKDLPERRPDLIALRLGYRSAAEDLRAAVLRRFPAFALGASYASDNTAVVSAGPRFSFALPIFNRNQGGIAKARASRRLLREKYEARLDRAVGAAEALAAQLDRLSTDLEERKRAAAAAGKLLLDARRAYREGNLDERALTDYETAATKRALEVAAIEQILGEDRVFLAVELGLGLPQTRLAARGKAS